MSICRGGPHWIPIVTAIYLPLTFFVTYGVAVAYQHVSPGFPYISDTGTYPPESCIFGQGLAIGAILSGLCVYIRYQHIIMIGGWRKLNLAGLILGCISAVGLSIVGNFQETSVNTVHDIGALMAFLVGVAYMWVNTVLTFKLLPLTQRAYIAYIRVIISSLSTIFAIIAIIGDVLSHIRYSGSGDQRHWRPTDGGYYMHVMSTISEWLMAFSFCSYFMTFVPEFYHLKLNAMTVTNWATDLVETVDGDEPIRNAEDDPENRGQHRSC